MLSIGSGFVVVCAESVVPEQRGALLERSRRPAGAW